MELLDNLMHLKNRMPVIIITGHGDIPMAIRAMKMGAMDFILKPFNSQLLINQIQSIISQSVVNKKELDDTTIILNLSTLTEREKEVLKLVIEGKLNKQIASELDIAISTVEFHRARLMKKMQAKNIAQLLSQWYLVSQ